MHLKTPGHELFIRQVQQAIARWKKSGKTFMTAFLTPSEQTLMEDLCKDVPYCLDGGRRHAERAVALIGTDFPEEEICVCLKSETDSRFDPLTHRDVLGALMNAGLEREVIGDISCTPEAVYVFCTPAITPYIIQTVTRIGRQSISFQVANGLQAPQAQLKEFTVNVASLRADGIVAALAKCSRTKATEMIRSSWIKVNDCVLEQNRTLCNNDCISIRHCGRFRFLAIKNTTRKGRLVLKIQQYQ